MTNDEILEAEELINGIRRDLQNESRARARCTWLSNGGVARSPKPQGVGRGDWVVQ